MNDDLKEMTREQLIDEVLKLRQAICDHRDCLGREPCWYDRPLWNLVPEASAPVREPSEWPEFLQSCLKGATP